MATYTIYARDYDASTGKSAWYGVTSAAAPTATAAVNGTGSLSVANYASSGAQQNTVYSVARGSDTGKSSSTYFAYQAFLEFDTSTTNIPSSETVTGVALKTYANGATTPSTEASTAVAYLRAYNDNVDGGSTAAFITPSTASGLTQVATGAIPGSNQAAGTAVSWTQTGTAFNTGLNRSGLTRVALVPDVSKSGAAFSNYSTHPMTTPRVSQNYGGPSPSAVPAANKPNIVVTTTAGSAQTVSPTGIGSAEAFGTPSVAVAGAPQTLTVNGIASAEAFGTPTVASNQVVSPTGIPTAQAFGVPVVSVAGVAQTLAMTGIGSAESFGTMSVQGAGTTGGLLIKTRVNGVWVSTNGASVMVTRISTTDSPFQAKPFQIVAVDASSGPVTVRAAAHSNGVGFTVKKLDSSANTVTVTSNSIDGATAYQLTAQNQSQDFMSDGAVHLLV